MLKRSLAGERLENDLESDVNGATRFAHSVLMPEKDADVVMVRVLILTINTLELKAAERHLAEQARIDSLTRLANRFAFNEALPRMLARSRRNADALMLLYLDIDHFKWTNDTLGHAAGDEVLYDFARRFQGCVCAPISWRGSEEMSLSW